MIWDRWEDAMDDLDDHEDVVERDITELQGQLTALGIPVPERRQRNSRGADTRSSAQDMYLDRGGEVSAVEYYRNDLRKLLEQFKERKRNNRRRAVAFSGVLLVIALAYGLWQVVDGFRSSAAPQVADGQRPISVDITLPEDWDIPTRVATALTLHLAIDRHPRLWVTAGNAAEQSQQELGSGLPLPEAHYTIRWSASGVSRQVDVSMIKVANPADAQRTRLFQQDSESDIDLAQRLTTIIAQHAAAP